MTAECLFICTVCNQLKCQSDMLIRNYYRKCLTFVLMVPWIEQKKCVAKIGGESSNLFQIRCCER